MKGKDREIKIHYFPDRFIDDEIRKTDKQSVLGNNESFSNVYSNVITFLITFNVKPNVCLTQGVLWVLSSGCVVLSLYSTQ